MVGVNAERTLATSMPASRRPRILFLSQVLPFPPDGGVKIRTYHVLRALSTEFDVTALCFYREKRGKLAARPQESLAALGEFCDVRAVPVPQDRRSARFAWDHLRSAASFTVYTRYVYASSWFRRILDQALAEKKFSIVHMDSLDLAGYLRHLRGLPVVCTHHDIQSDLLKRRAVLERNTLLRIYLRLQAALMAREEKKLCPRFMLNVTVSDRDRDLLTQRAPGSRIAVVPNGVDTDYFRPAGASGEGLVFVGGTTWFPNQDALHYFAAELLPRIRERFTSPVPVTWVGRSTETERARFAGLGIRMTGYVEDIRPFVREARCYIVPLRVGGGTRIKILDAWAMGKPVVSTSIGCSGLAARDGENIIVRDEPDDFVSAIAEVMDSRALREKLGQAGRKTAEEQYSWGAIGERLVKLYHKAIRAN